MLEIKDIKKVDKRQKFYRAVVEDYNDPQKMGRVRVRVVGIHTWDKSEVPTDTLPWAEVITDNMFGGNAGVGTSAVPLQGTWCWVFFDNDDYNYPVLFGLITGKAVDPGSDGFSDPAGKYPFKDRLDEPDMHRLARGEKISETIDKDQKDKHDNKADGEFDSGDIEFEEIHSNSKYPDNTVQETATGHHFIVDDTPGNERIMTYHRKGTFEEYRPNGSLMSKVTANRHTSTTGHYEEHIRSYMQTVIESYQKEHIKKWRQIIINENDSKYVGKDYGRRVGGSDFKDVAKMGVHKFGEDYIVTARNVYFN